MRRSVFLAALLAVACLAFAHPAFAQAQTDVIRGRVTGPDTLPVQGVNVKATSYQGNVSKSTKTAKNGTYTIIFPNGEGDYWLEFTAIGFAPKRFEIKRVGEEEIMIADTKMASNIAQLDAVNVIGQANRATPNRNANSNDVGGGDKGLGGVVVPPDQAGNLAAMAAALPGIQLIPGMDGAADMFSALGLGGDQNNTTFNGLGSGINTIPPDTRIGTSFNAYPWDPSRGGFSGAQISLFSVAGTNYSSRSTSGFGTGPALEWTDQSGDSTGAKSTTLRLGGRAGGPITLDKRFYNSSYSVSRNFADVFSLLNTSPIGLATAGVSADSAARLVNILRGKGVPVSVEKNPTIRANDQAQVYTNIDLVPSTSGTGNSFTITLSSAYNHSQPAGLGGGSLLTSAPSREGQSEVWALNGSVGHSNYFWFGILSKSSVAYSTTHFQTWPFLNFPQGSVRVNSQLSDGTNSIKSLFFGGGQPPVAQTLSTAAATNQLTWYSSNNRHTIKVSSSISREQNINDQAVGAGNFSFNSLADLEAGRPASYSRTLTPVHSVNGQITGGASIGDSWRPKIEGNTVQVTYGLRADANHFLYSPQFNQSVLDTFGINNNKVPNKFYLSPRLGVQWTYGKAPQIAYAPGSARPPLAVIHWGAGVFQNIGSASLIGNAVALTGLPSAVQSVQCVGPATPIPDWTSYLLNPSEVPTTCADGSSGTTFSSGAPTVFAFDPHFKQARSLRTAGDWSSPILDNRFVLGVQGIYSYNIEQQNAVDINFNPTSRFNLANEGNRPVYADASAIVATTGSIAPRSTRVSTAFQRVQLTKSDLHSKSTQATVRLSPVTTNKYLRWDLSYTLLDVRDQFSGFSSTVGNPFDNSWGAHTASGKHDVRLTWSSIPIADLIFINVQVGAHSGAKFTPMIAGDVNGDGSFNDRAFVFDPTHTSDNAVASGMQELLDHGSPAARKCLEKQLNSLSGRGTCQAPWVATGQLSINFNAQKIGLPKRASVSLTFTNPLTVADLIVNGSKNAHGWGQDLTPDGNLLFVKGFDPVSQTYKYDVNQRFGSTSPQSVVSRSPAYVSLNISYDIGFTRERQTLTQRLDMGRGREGTKQPAAAFKQFGTQSIPNPMAIILQQPDSLKLTRKQADSLASLSRKFTLHADSIWTPVSKGLEALPDGYDRGEAYDQYVKAREATVDYLLTLVPDVKSLLTASQKRKLPLLVSNYLDERVLKFMRSSSAGDGGNFIIR